MQHNSFSKPRSLVDQLKHDLSEAIVKGTLLPGQQIKEIELQEWFNVSRAPIREALRLLEGDGLVVVDNYKKRHVRRITRKDLDDIFPVMACLEGLAARFAALKLTQGEIQELKDLNDQMKTAFENKAYQSCAELNFKFHRTYIKTIDNRALERSMRYLTRGLIWLWLANIYYKQEKLIRISISEHNKIIDALSKKDANKADKNVRDHILNVYKRSLRHAIFDSNGDWVLENHPAIEYG